MYRWVQQCADITYGTLVQALKHANTQCTISMKAWQSRSEIANAVKGCRCFNRRHTNFVSDCDSDVTLSFKQTTIDPYHEATERSEHNAVIDK